MDDKTMLELAARAAGIAIQRSRLDDPVCRDMLLSVDQRDETGRAIGWNPLTDDGDAQRLAVKLRIDVHTSDTFGTNGAGFTTADCFRGGKIISMQVPHNSDPYAATRRAIVRAAAEIGKGMGVG